MRHRVVALASFGRAARATFRLSIACSLLCGVPAFAQPAAPSVSAPARAAPPAALPSAAAPRERDVGAPADAVRSETAPPVEEDPKLRELSTLASQLRALLAGQLELAVDPTALFDVELDDDQAVELERKRLAAIVGAANGETQETGEAATADNRAPSEGVVTQPSASAAAPAADAGTPPPHDLDAELWRARLAVDQARLAIYDLPREQRLKLLTDHEKRQQEKLGSKQASAVNEAEQRAKSADKKRQEALGAANDEQLEAAALEFDKTDNNQGILIDDAHRLIRPAMGGLKNFDRVIASARRCSRHTAWVFAFDSIIWQFFERMRGSRPLFDRVIRLVPWTDAGIANLLSARTEAAKLDVDFSALLGELPADADELDIQEALDRVELGYYRLIWDYADGNPGVALMAWSDSLALDSEGQPSVKVFQAPDADALEGLPDDAKFVLRAVVQLERAKAESISQATGVGLSAVEDALRYGYARGYFSQNEVGYAVTWRWFRAITRYLARHHLLISAAKAAE